MSLMLVNPAHRPKRRRSAAQKAATRRLVAANRAKRASPASKRRTRRASAVRHHNPIGLSRVTHRRHHRRARRHNPISLRGGNMGGMIMNGLKGAVASVAINAVTHFLPAPVATGNVMYVTRLALALVVGTLGGKVIGRENARAAAEGAMAVNFADVINSFGGAMLPGSHLHGTGAYLSNGGMGAYLSALPGHDVNNAGVNVMDSELSGMAVR